MAIDVTGGLAKAVAALPAEIQPMAQGLADTLIAALNQALGETLADVTAERTETINQLAEVLHGVLDRANGTAVVLGHGASPYGFTLIVPERVKT